jgi:glycosyltransferase involved in cell wall biosynthesis
VPRLLYISPILPDVIGNGLAQRAALFLDAAAMDHEVHLVVVPVAGGGREPSPFVREHAARVEVVALEPPPDASDMVGVLRAQLGDPRPRAAQAISPELARWIADRFAGTRLDVVHVARLYLAELTTPHLESPKRPLVTLDLDDVESSTHRRLSGRARVRGDATMAYALDADAFKYDVLERRWLGRFDLVFVASDADEAVLAQWLNLHNLAVVPNAAPLVAEAARAPDEAPTLLFVGNLSYFPNQEAATFLVEQVLPRLRRHLPARLLLVGSSAPPAVTALASADFVELHADVAEVAPVYRRAHLAALPLFAGGGTRIKVLEAFAHLLPVVATPIALEGIGARSGEHALVAESADDFSEACRACLTERERATRLAAAARRLVDERYEHERVRERIRAAFAVARRQREAEP